MSPENRRVHVAAEVTRRDDALRAARELHKLGLFHDAVSRAYYAALHDARALLASEGIEAHTHGGVGTMIGLHFITSGRLDAGRAKDLSRLEQFRGEADDNRFFVLTAEGAQEELDVADRFCREAHAWLGANGWLA